jgi:serine/threonine protein kinase
MSKHKRLETAFTRYELLNVIGQGGVGTVWRATDPAGANVAVKILAAERVNAERRKRFKNEILFGERAQHPHIVHVLDHGITADSTSFYVMPLLDGSFRDRLGSVPNAAAKLAYFDHVLSGVEAAHLQGVTHRDLKPENILYDRSRDALVVADFGIATFRDEELFTAVETAPHTRLANFLYSAPEQRIRGRLVDLRADLYALGLMLNEMFTGEVPQGAGFRTVASVAPEHAWIDEVVAEMLQQDPHKRPTSVDAVKRQFVARRLNSVTRQRLSSISKTVIPVGDEDDPLAIKAPQLIDFEWEKGRLTLILDRAVNPQWVQALQNMGSHTSVLGKGPETFSFSGDRASVAARDSEVQYVIDCFKGWLQRATDVYRDQRARERRELVEREKSRLRAEQEELERRQRLRSSIKI